MTVGFNERNTSFIQKIEETLNDKITVVPLDDYDCDLKLIFIETGGSEMLFKKQMDKLKEPYYFLTSGENNSLAATLEILTYLKSNNKQGEIIHGSIDYISSRIKELTNKDKKRVLEGKQYGVIGEPSDWLISSVPNYDDVKQKYGANLINIPLFELINEFKNFNEKISVENKGFDEREVKNAEKVYLILKDIIKKYKLDGLTIRCFDLLKSIKTTGCLALSKLNSEGIIATCEGDIMAMLCMAIAKEISSHSSFQANPSQINVNDNTILFAHCTVPLDMLTSYTFKTHFESGIGVAIKGELKKQDVTVLRISKDLKHYYVSKGKILKNMSLDNLCRTQILVHLESDVKELLNNPCGNHHIIFYGDYEEQLRDYLS